MTHEDGIQVENFVIAPLHWMTVALEDDPLEETHVVAPRPWKTIGGGAKVEREERPHRSLTWMNRAKHADGIRLVRDADLLHKDLVQGSHKVVMYRIAIVEENVVVPNPPVPRTTNDNTEEIVKNQKHHPAANRVAVVDESVKNADERIPAHPLHRVDPARIRTINTTKSTLAW